MVFLFYVMLGYIESGTCGTSGIGRGEDSLKINLCAQRCDIREARMATIRGRQTS